MEVIILNSQHDEVIPSERIEVGSIAIHFYNRLIINTVTHPNGERFYYRSLTDISDKESSLSGYIFTIKFSFSGKVSTFTIESTEQIYNLLKIRLAKNKKADFYRRPKITASRYSQSITEEEKKNVKGCGACGKRRKK